VLRYTETGLRKRAEVGRGLGICKREEDAGQHGRNSVPPKYVTKDFRRQTTGASRRPGCSEERFILQYCSMERDLGPDLQCWVGRLEPTWSKAQALATYYQRMRTEEAGTERPETVLAECWTSNLATAMA